MDINNSQTSLYLVPTPIGNLEDMTYRGVKILSSVDLILAEDTRTTKKLLQHYGIQTSLRSFHEHNEHKVLEELAEQLKAGTVMAQVSDAGTPGISDPGFLLARRCREEGLKTECLPGATALIPALVQSGLPCDRFVFEGFLPHKKGRSTRLQALAAEERSIVLYESPHRIQKTLGQLKETLGPERPASVSRELSKVYEETVNGTLDELYQAFEEKQAKGEFVILVGGARLAK